MFWVHEAPSSNLGAPTIFLFIVPFSNGHSFAEVMGHDPFMKISRLPLYVTCALALAASMPASVAFAADVGPKIKLKQGQTYMGRFVHDHPIQGIQQPLHSEGRFTVTRGDAITWEIEKPMMTSTIITPKGLSQTLGEFPMLSIKPDRVPFIAVIERDLLWALAGDWDKLRKDFTISTSGTDEAWVATITPIVKPNEKAKPFQKIVAKGGRYVDSAEIILPSGAVDTVSFSDQFITK